MDTINCFKCDTPNPKGSNFCGNCGNQLQKPKPTTKPKYPFNNLEGKWKVTTEGDVEGTTKFLGNFEGKIDEIARQLAHKSCYSLRFDAFDDLRRENLDRKEVNISFPSDYGKRKMDALFADAPVVVKDCNYYHSYTLKFDKVEETDNE